MSDITPITSGFECDFSIEGSDLSGELSVSRDKTLTVVFSGPDIINGTSICINGEVVKVEVQGITEKYARSTVPESSPALCIYDALISAEGITPTVKNDEIYIEGESRSGNFSAALNGTGFITEITFESCAATVIFKNSYRIS